MVFADSVGQFCKLWKVFMSKMMLRIRVCSSESAPHAILIFETFVLSPKPK